MILHGNYGESEKIDREGKYEFRVMTKVSVKKLVKMVNYVKTSQTKKSSNCQGYEVKITTNLIFSRFFFQKMINSVVKIVVCFDQEKSSNWQGYKVKIKTNLMFSRIFFIKNRQNVTFTY